MKTQYYKDTIKERVYKGHTISTVYARVIYYTIDGKGFYSSVRFAKLAIDKEEV